MPTADTRPWVVLAWPELDADHKGIDARVIGPFADKAAADRFAMSLTTLNVNAVSKPLCPMEGV